MRHTFRRPTRLPRDLVALLAVLLAAAPAAAQVDGSPDPTFGDDGVVRSLGFFQEMRLTALAPAQDMLVAAGDRRSVPLPPDPPGQWHTHWWSVDRAGNPAQPACTGASTSTFPVSFAASSRAEVALVDRAGRLLVGGSMAVIGTEGQDRALLSRFDLGQAGCAADSTFSGLGWEVYDDTEPCASTDCSVIDLVEQTPATGAVAATRYVALVRAATGGLGASRLFLLGLEADGDPDPAFGGGDGWVEVDHAGFGLALFGDAALAVDPSGRLFVAVTHSDAADSLDLDVSALRYLPGGAIDGSFGTAGRVAVVGAAPDGADSRASGIEVHADGSLFVGWLSANADAGARVWGRSANGGVTAQLFLGMAGLPHLALQGNRRLLATYDTDAIEPDTFRAARFVLATGGHPGLFLDSTWGTSGIAVHDVDLATGDVPDTVTAIALWHGRPVYGGNIGVNSAFLLRVANRYVFADGFEGGTLASW
jgi:hypothetical protein